MAPKLTKDEVFEKLKEILFNTNFVENIQPESRLEDDLGLDSLDIAEIIVECEKEFHILIEDDKLEEIKTMQELVDLISEKLSKQ